MELISVLQKIGLNERQSSLYFSLLQGGSSNIQEITQKSHIKRTTAYSILDTLIQKGLATMSKKDGHREYFAEDPQKIPLLFENQIMLIEQQKKEITEIIPELHSFYNTQTKKPKIRFYEGIEGIKLVLNETLDIPAGEEILAYSSAESIHQYLGDEYVSYYLSMRIKKRIRQRAIAEDSEEAREHQKNDIQELRKTRLINQELFPFSNEINIFKNKICIISYKDLLGIIIESTEIAKTQKSIFELAWLGASKII